MKHYVSLQGYELLFYPDLKAKDLGHKPSYVFCLLQTTVSPYNKDKKKVNVFQVSVCGVCVYVCAHSCVYTYVYANAGTHVYAYVHVVTPYLLHYVCKFELPFPFVLVFLSL